MSAAAGTASSVTAASVTTNVTESMYAEFFMIVSFRFVIKFLIDCILLSYTRECKQCSGFSEKIMKFNGGGCILDVVSLCCCGGYSKSYPA